MLARSLRFAPFLLLVAVLNNCSSAPAEDDDALATADAVKGPGGRGGDADPKPQTCGQGGQKSCGGTCLLMNLVVVDGICRVCGGAGQPQCYSWAPRLCQDGLEPDRGICSSPWGSKGQRCSIDGACDGNLRCQDGICDRCGLAGEACCGRGPTCRQDGVASGFDVIGGCQCDWCGGEGQQCCDGQCPNGRECKLVDLFGAKKCYAPSKGGGGGGGGASTVPHACGQTCAPGWHPTKRVWLDECGSQGYVGAGVECAADTVSFTQCSEGCPEGYDKVPSGSRCLDSCNRGAIVGVAGEVCTVDHPFNASLCTRR